MERQLTKNKDVDLIILSNLEDKDLFNFCKIKNKYVYNLCSNENFWRKRTYEKYSNLIKFKPVEQNWKDYYIYITYWISKLKEEFNFISNDMRDDPEKYYDIFSIYREELNNPKNLMFYGVDDIDSLGYKIRVMEEELMNRGIKLNYYDLVQYAVNNGVDNFQGGLDTSAYYGNFETFNYFESLGANDYLEALESTQIPKMIEYIRSKM